MSRTTGKTELRQSAALLKAAAGAFQRTKTTNNNERKMLTTIKTTVAVTLGVLLASAIPQGLKGLDPNGTGSFNKNIVRQYMLARGIQQKLPFIIDDVSDTQKITFHGEELLVSAVLVKGASLMSMIYFVSKPGDTSYLSGGSDLLKEIDQIGYDAESRKLAAK